VPVERVSSGGPWEDSVGYSRVVVTGGYGGFTGWTAGCTAMVGGVVQHEGDAFGQAMVAFQSSLFALERAGFARVDTIMTRMYVVNIKANAEFVGQAHHELLGTIRPAATMVGVSELIDDRLLVEVEVVAWRPDDNIVA
jgi:enamine deaminase RidA (YjgF/YER057c/UK114 family)